MFWQLKACQKDIWLSIKQIQRLFLGLVVEGFNTVGRIENFSTEQNILELLLMEHLAPIIRKFIEVSFLTLPIS